MLLYFIYHIHVKNTGTSTNVQKKKLKKEKYPKKFFVVPSMQPEDFAIFGTCQAILFQHLATTYLKTEGLPIHPFLTPRWLKIHQGKSQGPLGGVAGQLEKGAG